MNPTSFFSTAVKNLSQLTLLALAILFPLSGWAQKVVEFTGDSGTDEFSDPESWKDGKVPGPEDTATFSLLGSYTVTFTEDIEIARLRMADGGHSVEPDVVTLALEGQTLSLTATLSPISKQRTGPFS